jgi:hypothetical protein
LGIWSANSAVSSSSATVVINRFFIRHHLQSGHISHIRGIRSNQNFQNAWLSIIPSNQCTSISFNHPS